MKKLLIIIIMNPLIQGCNKEPVYSIFDSHLPGTVPEIFAENIFNRDRSYIGYCSFDQNTNEFYYAVTNQQWNTSRILKLSDKMQIDTIRFNVNEFWEGEPMFTMDGKRMYFTAIIPPENNIDWHADLYYIEKTNHLHVM